MELENVYLQVRITQLDTFCPTALPYWDTNAVLGENEYLSVKVRRPE